MLIENASKWHKLWSMRFIILTAFFSSISAAYILLPADWLPTIPDWLKAALAVGTLLAAGAAGVARVVKQEGV